MSTIFKDTTLEEQATKNIERLSLDGLILSNYDQKKALADLEDFQIEHLKELIDNIDNKYNHLTAVEAVGVSLDMASYFGSLTSDTLVVNAERVLDPESRDVVVRANSARALALKILEGATDAIDDATELRANSRGDFTDAAKWWTFINLEGKEALVDALTFTLISKHFLYELHYNGVRYVSVYDLEELSYLL